MPLDSSAPSPLPRVFRLADWTVERDVDRLCDHTRTQHVEPKAMDVLCCLAARAGQTVSREALLDAVWHERHVGEEVLTRVIGQLRAAMHDDPKRPAIIQTVPRRGYRLLVAVEAAESPPPAPVQTSLATTTPLSPAHWRWLWVATGLAACFAVGLVGRQILSAPADSVAVLPFRNLSGDPAQDYLSESVADNLITALARLPAVRVSSRGSSFAARREESDSRRLGQRLGVDILVEGSLVADDAGMAMAARLVDTRDGAVLWSFKSAGVGPQAQRRLQEQLAEQLRAVR